MNSCCVIKQCTLLSNRQLHSKVYSQRHHGCSNHHGVTGRLLQLPPAGIKEGLASPGHQISTVGQLHHGSVENDAHTAPVEPVKVAV